MYFRTNIARFCLGSFAILILLTFGFTWDVKTIEAQIPGGTLDPSSVPKYVEPLIIPPAMEPVGQSGAFTEYEIAVRQFSQQVLPDPYPETKVWGYGNPNISGTVAEGGSFNFPAFTVEAHRNQPIRVTWINDLVAPNGDCLPHLLPVDQTLHWANPPGGGAGRDSRGTNPDPYLGPVPMVTHVHGARVPGTSDGYPEAWWLPDCNVPAGYAETGSTYFSEQSAAPGTAVFEYPNDQRATTLWYHDHALGITRLNVYAGMAGFWLLRDDEEASLNLPGPAPQLGDAPGTKYYEIPIVIQDRSFNVDGSFFYPNSRTFFDEFPGPYVPNSDVSPTWNPEFFGNMMVVNGRTWPYLEVEPRLYRLRFLNGTNSRFLILEMENQATTFNLIGTEGGLLPGAPLPLNRLLMAPAERADVLVDFSQFAPDTKITLLNLGPDEPYGGGEPGYDFDPADPNSTGQVMQFQVVAATGKKINRRDRIPTTLPAITPLGAPVESRDITLNEEVSSLADIPIAAFLGTPEDGPLGWGDDITENPVLGDTEIWNIINLTEDAHPIHLHLVMFQVVDRIFIDAEAFADAQELYLQGYLSDPPNWEDFQYPNNIYPPEAWETGWKDTVIAKPAEVTRIKARFDLPGLYVWHCHILEHEDNEMMRPYQVLLNNALTVNIDVLPNDPYNLFDCNNDNSLIDVAILGSPSFDVTTVDHASVRFEGAWETHLDKTSQRIRHVETDVNNDGYLDLVLHFRVGETDLNCDSTEASLMAYTYDGNVIFGADAVQSISSAISCSATYWANNLGAWQSVYTPDVRVNTVFTALPNGKFDLNGDGQHDTLLDALNYGTDTPLHSALREGVAAILNDEHPDIDYPTPWYQIINLVNNAVGDDTALYALSMDLLMDNNTYCLAP